MVKKFGFLSLIALIIIIIFTWSSEVMDKKTISKLESELMTILSLSEQIKLNNDTVLGFKNKLNSIDAVNVSISSLVNVHQFYLKNMYDLNLNETERFHEINYLFNKYWTLTRTKDNITRENLSAMLIIEQDIAKITDSISKEIEKLQTKQRIFFDSSSGM